MCVLLFFLCKSTFLSSKAYPIGQRMLRNRSRAVSGKQSLMTDHSSQQPSPTQKRSRPVQSFFDSPRFRALTAKGLSETDFLISPTSILDTLPFSPFGHPYKSQPESPKTFSRNKHCSWEKIDSKGVGLALVDTLIADGSIAESCSKPSNGKVFFGTNLRVQIPPLPPSAISPSDQSPISTAENLQPSEFGSPRVVAGNLSVSEMELSEDYTCVISRGPIQRTTRIFDNCIVESYCSLPGEPNAAFQDFLSLCYTCRKNLEQSKDIYIYRFGPFPSFLLYLWTRKNPSSYLIFSLFKTYIFILLYD